jgi:hypothetical protein
LVEGCVLETLGFMRTPVRRGHDRGLTPQTPHMALRGVGVGLDDALGILVRAKALRVLLLATLGRVRLLFLARRFRQIGHGYRAIRWK